MLDQPTDRDPLPPSCACNGEALALVLTCPRVGPLPELRTYRCADCGHVVTLEDD